MSQKIILSRADQEKLLRDTAILLREREQYFSKVAFDDDLLMYGREIASGLDACIHNADLETFHTTEEIEEIRTEMIVDAAYRNDVRAEYFASQGA